MKYLALLLALTLTSCVFTVRPIDIIGGRPYCQPVHQDVWNCRDDYGTPWRCVHAGGRWRCRRW